MWKDVPERRNADMEIGKKLKDARNPDLPRKQLQKRSMCPDRPFQTGKMKNPIRIL